MGPLADSFLMPLMLQEEKTQPLECSGGGEAGSREASGHSPVGLGWGVWRTCLLRQVRPWCWAAGLRGAPAPNTHMCFPAKAVWLFPLC